MPISHITQSRLEALLEISIRTSAADKDPYKDDLRIVLSPTDLITQLMRIISIDSHDEAAVRKLNPTDHGLSGNGSKNWIKNIKVFELELIGHKTNNEL